VIQFATEIKRMIANASHPLERRIDLLEQQVEQLRGRVKDLEGVAE
jgi:hypothetical protein